MMTETEILARIDRLTEERLTLCLAQDWVHPLTSDEATGFDETDLARLRLIVELTEDLEVNDAAVPLILNLIDEVSGLRRRMRAVDSALGEMPELRARLIARLDASAPAEG
ncbi:chaperone modulator CbpM [Paenirhodobacter enshiensis]|uniref:chaperone modulator CbpM n=1 Tax=Paenirhodobacter enshiensis TaxID=1105367 RepID=UPI0035B34247